MTRPRRSRAPAGQPAPSRHRSAGSSVCFFRFALRLSKGCASLARQELPLAVHAAAVPAEVAVPANYAVARYRERHRVIRAGVRHRPHRLRPADLFRDLAIGPCLAVRDRSQGLVDAPLERRYPYVQRKTDAWFPGCDVPNQRLYPVRQFAWLACARPLDLGRGVLLAENRFQVIVAVAHLHGADAALGGPDEQAAELRIDDRVANAHTAAAAAVCSRRHAQHRVRRLVQPAARTVAGVVERPGYVSAVAQPVLEALDAAGGGVLARRDAQCLPEHALKPARAYTELSADGSQPR